MIGKVSGSWALVVMAFSLVNAGTFNAYTGAFQILAFTGMWRRFRSESFAVRLIPFGLVMAAGVVVALLGYRSFVTNLSNFLDVLLVLFIPGRRSTWPTISSFAALATTSPRSSYPARCTATSPGAARWPTRPAWPRNGRSCRSPTTRARSSPAWAAPTSPG